MPQVPAPTQAVRKALPALAKQLPKLWPLLLESKNREKIGDLARDLAAQSPKRRLGAKIRITQSLADTIGEKATTESERSRAEAWRSRAQKMLVRLDMPVAGVKDRRRHRSQIRHDLAELHAEMNEALSEE